MGAFNLGAFGAPPAGALADRYRGYRGIAVARAALCAVSLWLFPLASSGVQLLLALADGAGFAGAVTIANLLIVERRPQSEWNQRLGWLETALSVGQDGALLLAAWLTGLGARSGLLIAALVPAAAIGLAVVLIPPVPGRAVSTQNELVTSWPMPAASGNGARRARRGVSTCTSGATRWPCCGRDRHEDLAGRRACRGGYPTDE